MTAIFEGLTVLDISRGMAGALTTMVLADGGAEVLKIEPPQGDLTRRQPAFMMWNRGKKSVVLDMKSPQGRDNFVRLAGVSDVLITTLSEAQLGKLGIDNKTLQAQNPSLIICSISGFGPLKQFAHLKGYEGIVAAKSGRLRVFDGQVQREGPVYAALNCGSFGAAMYALQGILAALHVRRTSGRGQNVRTSLLQALCTFDYRFLRWQTERRPDIPLKGYNRGTPPPQYFISRCKDGKWIQMANAMSHLMVNFIVGVGATELLDNPLYLDLLEGNSWEDIEELHPVLHEKMAQKTLDEWMHLFTSELDVAAEPFLTTQQGMLHPQILHNGNIVEHDDPAVGHTRQLGPLMSFSETPMAAQGPSPKLGEHTLEVLSSIPNRRLNCKPTRRPVPKQPLAGVTIVEFATWLAGPLASAVLTELGARVIKVESLGGDAFRGLGVMAPRAFHGKESVALDMKKAEGRELGYELVRRADVLMSNIRVSAASRMGIRYEQVRELNPRLVYVYGGSYGSSGPSAQRAAMHPIPGAVCGGALYQAGQGMPPAPEKPMSFAELRRTSASLYIANEGNPDIIAGLASANAILMGLYAREQTGKGQYIETTMMCSNLYANSDDALSYQGKPDRLLPDESLYGLHALYRLYPAKRGWVFLACPEQHEWELFCQLVERDALRDDPRFRTMERRLENDAVLASIVERILADRTDGEWEHFLSRRGIGCAAVRETGFDDLANTLEEMKESGSWVEVEHPSVGKYWRYGPSVTSPEWEANIRPPVDLGENTVTVLKELGLADEAIADLARRQVIGVKGLQVPS